MRNNFIIFFFTLICFSCQSNADKSSTSIAGDICDCFRPLVEMNEKVQALLKDGRGGEAEKLLPEIDQLQKNGQQCSASLVKKYGAETKLDTDMINTIMKVECPAIQEIVGPALFQ